jgi:hypothetical protein
MLEWLIGWTLENFLDRGKSAGTLGGRGCSEISGKTTVLLFLSILTMKMMEKNA